MFKDVALRRKADIGQNAGSLNKDFKFIKPVLKVKGPIAILNINKITLCHNPKKLKHYPIKSSFIKSKSVESR